MGGMILTKSLVLSDTPVDQVKTLPGGEGATDAAAASRKRLMLSVAEKEKLLNWDTLVASEEALQHNEQVEFIIQQFRGRNKSLSSSLLPSSPFYLSA